MSDQSPAAGTAALPPQRYTPATAWPAEGERVGIVTCLQCGAAVFLSVLADSMTMHDAWHAQQAQRHLAVPHHTHEPGDLGP